MQNCKQQLTLNIDGRDAGGLSVAAIISSSRFQLNFSPSKPHSVIIQLFDFVLLIRLQFGGIMREIRRRHVYRAILLRGGTIQLECVVNEELVLSWDQF